MTQAAQSNHGWRRLWIFKKWRSPEPSPPRKLTVWKGLGLMILHPTLSKCKISGSELWWFASVAWDGYSHRIICLHRITPVSRMLPAIRCQLRPQCLRHCRMGPDRRERRQWTPPQACLNEKRRGAACPAILFMIRGISGPFQLRLRRGTICCLRPSWWEER